MHSTISGARTREVTVVSRRISLRQQSDSPEQQSKDTGESSTALAIFFTIATASRKITPWQWSWVLRQPTKDLQMPSTPPETLPARSRSSRDHLKGREWFLNAAEQGSRCLRIVLVYSSHKDKGSLRNTTKQWNGSKKSRQSRSDGRPV